MLTFIDPGPDREFRAKYGLGGAAQVDDLVFAGSMAIDMEKQTRVPNTDTIAAETRHCVEKFARTLAQAGCTLADVAKINCFVTDLSYCTEMWATLDEMFADVATPKYLTLLGGIAAQCHIEFEVLAVTPNGEPWTIAHVDATTTEPETAR